MRGATAKAIRKHAYALFMQPHTFDRHPELRKDGYRRVMATGEIRCTGFRALYQAVKKTWKRTGRLPLMASAGGA